MVTDFNTEGVRGTDVFALTSNTYAGAPGAGTPVVLSNAMDAVNSANNIILDTLANIEGLDSSRGLANTRFAYASDVNQLMYDANGNWAEGSLVVADVTLTGDLTAANFAFI